eukprot:CAMPEP_0167758082 /NCGR_PEP_ID=MMETSP0110_2-20121227/10275_1 /TAXON_ID=629695 /ORGANISM="Gymnochlora sp., Strain CCMP2014" /LENGTH=201 /DNA_ID=CAMNT_0007644327 /DNA_START=26 /DNA_END=631 /DNA_ORIENTATION=+
MAAPPSYCHGIDCPVFDVKDHVSNGGTELEVRHYPSAKWVSTDIMSDNEDTAISTGFMRLFSYISGANVNKEKVDMTSPVMCRVKDVGQGPFCNTTFTVSFFVPFKHQDDAPTPSSEDVYIDIVEERTVAVLQGDGYWMQADVLKNVAAAQAVLKAKNVGFNTTTYTFAGYDPPFRVFGRHNEVWLDLISSYEAERAALEN